MFKKTLAKFSVLLFLVAFLLPAGTVYAQSSDSTVVTGTDPVPTGEPRVTDDGSDAMMLALEVGVLTAM